mmetsp:Transcript_21722/g.32307  ORF Transcript_21722/g.32307 Transcript_21722/m.32307 type:complete len:91 (+) Transcript_21722:1410-1682(+)
MERRVELSSLLRADDDETTRCCESLAFPMKALPPTVAECVKADAAAGISAMVHKHNFMILFIYFKFLPPKDVQKTKCVYVLMMTIDLGGV